MNVKTDGTQESSGRGCRSRNPALTLDELKKKLLARGKKRGSLTYEEINTAFDALDDVNPEQIDELFEEITAAGIEIVDEQKEEKPEAEARGRARGADSRRALARRSGPHVSQGDRARSAALDGAREVAGDADRSRRTRSAEERHRRFAPGRPTAKKPSASSPKPTCASSSRSRRSTSAAACSSWT